MKTISNKLDYTFRAGARKGENYFITLSLTCKNPMCSCTDVLLQISEKEDFSDSTYQYAFSIDTAIRVLKNSKNVEENQITKNFAKSFVNHLNDEDWDYFSTFFRSSKAATSKDIKNLNELEFDFSPLEYGIEGNRMLISYSDIFPFAEEFIISYANKKYLLSDHYCLNTSCKCRDTLFAVLEVTNNRVVANDASYEIPYSYTKGLWDKNTVYDGLIKELKKSYPDINIELKKRHRILRTLYSNYLNENGSSEINKPISIGRNDLCPCGSGKKYKRCCG